jgi:CDP-diacylglycerol--glycerol-3-phosphate 3-phosphatidyltransferase
MTIYTLKPKFQMLLSSTTDLLVRRRIHPDTITLAGLGCALVAAVIITSTGLHPEQPMRWLLLLVPPLLAMRTACNALDGLVARSSGLARPAGALLNEVCDRLADLACFAALVFSGMVAPWMGALLLVLLLLVSYLGMLPQALGGSRRYDGPMGKADRMLALSVYCLVAPVMGSAGVAPLFLGQIFGGLLVVGLLATVILRLQHSWRELNR